MATIMYNGGYIKDFGELKKWWMEHGVHQDEKDRKTQKAAPEKDTRLKDVLPKIFQW